MLELEPDVQAEYLRVIEDFEPIMRFGAPCLSVEDVLRAHFLIANHFLLEGQGIGGVGPKDKSLLESAVYRQVVSLGGILKWTNLFDIVATLFYGIIKDHAFYDANKRTAFLTALYQLHQGGFCLSVDEKIVEDFTVDVADNKLDKFSRYRDLKKSRDLNPEIKMISWFFRDKTRRIDNKRYIVTYRELNKILSRYGYFLEDPEDNRIDVVKYQKKKKIFGFIGEGGEERIRLGRIGFPRWGAQVLPSEIKSVRKMTNLVPEEGVDAASFFHGLDDMQSLIASYNEPLMRLAYR